MKKLSVSEEKLKCYPHELSGGMLQRIVGAMVILCKPKLIIAYEPTTALDVSIQLQYLKLLKQIQKEYHTSIIFISHDIKVISMMCDRIAVMYGGRIVEQGSAKELFEHPVHPYTRALFRSGNMGGIPHEQYETIEGNPPDLHQKSVGCPFADRCKHARQKCHEEMPELNIFEGGHEALCWRPRV
jgi:oligopeptide/dipeptide ABC transporter ATP-binding protein